MTHPTQLDARTAHDWITGQDAPLLVDVRTPAEFAGGHLDGAVNIPLDLLKAQASPLAEEMPGEVLLVCRTDNRANQASVALAEHIGPRAHVLTGGMQAWQQAQLPTTSQEGGPWAMERQVRAVAGGIVLAGILASTRVSRAKWLSAGIGTGLLYSGLSDTCGMAALLARAPWNQARSCPTPDSVRHALRARRQAR
ncbi:rhodanese-like domain-containing protein [Luteococcus sp.]|uniref:rhodanese-like domain-containing protein n=1 Tax=Luteococcus sp. TaxID=1969402 RepID=UPI0037355CC8